MTAQEIRNKYLEFFESRGHKIIPRASLVPQNDPTTLFTGSGMQPLVPYLLGQTHPDGKRLVDNQTCFRAEDMDEVGDNRHTTFFEMLGTLSLIRPTANRCQALLKIGHFDADYLCPHPVLFLGQLIHRFWSELRKLDDVFA